MGQMTTQNVTAKTLCRRDNRRLQQKVLIVECTRLHSIVPYKPGKSVLSAIRSLTTDRTASSPPKGLGTQVSSHITTPYYAW